MQCIFGETSLKMTSLRVTSLSYMRKIKLSLSNSSFSTCHTKNMKSLIHNKMMINKNHKYLIFQNDISLFRYFIPGKFIPCLYNTALNTNQIIYEDVFVTGIIAQACEFQVPILQKYYMLLTYCYLCD